MMLQPKMPKGKVTFSKPMGWVKDHVLVDGDQSCLRVVGGEGVSIPR